VVRTGESSATTGAEAVGRAVERRGCAAGGLSKEDTVRLSKLTVGQETEEVTEAGLGTSQEEELVLMSQRLDSLAEMGWGAPDRVRTCACSC